MLTKDTQTTDLSNLTVWKEMWGYLWIMLSLNGLANKHFLSIAHPAAFNEEEAKSIRTLADHEYTLMKKLQNVEDDQWKYKTQTYIRNDSCNIGTIKLHGAEISSHTPKPNATDLHFFYIPGNCASAMEYKKEAKLDISTGKKYNLNITAHLIDPRGVGISANGNYFYAKGFYSNQIINDYIAIIKNKIDKKLGGINNAYKCVISGISLGGGLAAQIISKLHNMGYKVQGDINASFGSLAGVICNPSTSFNFLKPFADAFTGILGWQLDLKEHLKNIDPANISYTNNECDGRMQQGSYHDSISNTREPKLNALDSLITSLSESKTQIKNSKDLLNYINQTENLDKYCYAPEFQTWLKKCDDIYNHPSALELDKSSEIIKANPAQRLYRIKYYQLTGCMLVPHSEYNSHSEYDSHNERLANLNAKRPEGMITPQGEKKILDGHEFRIANIAQKTAYSKRTSYMKEPSLAEACGYFLGTITEELLRPICFILACIKTKTTKEINQKSAKFRKKGGFWNFFKSGFLNEVHEEHKIVGNNKFNECKPKTQPPKIK